MTLILAHGAPRYNPNDIGIGALGGAGDWLAIGLTFAFVIMTMVRRSAVPWPSMLPIFLANGRVVLRDEDRPAADAAGVEVS